MSSWVMPPHPSTTAVLSYRQRAISPQLSVLTTIPSDGASHNVTITDLELNAEMSWISVPKKSPKAHLTVEVKDESEYTFFSGTAVYVDGNFISRSDVPAVSPEESFDCPVRNSFACCLPLPPRFSKY